ncbi:MAG: hypothetical protein WCL16_11000 [bacterium]
MALVIFAGVTDVPAVEQPTNALSSVTATNALAAPAATNPIPSFVSAAATNRPVGKALAELHSQQGKLMREMSDLDERLAALGRKARESREAAMGQDPELRQLAQQIAAQQAELERRFREKHKDADALVREQAKMLGEYEALRARLLKLQAQESGIRLDGKR